MNDTPNNEAKEKINSQPKCEFCGCFMKKVNSDLKWQCPKVFYDNHAGAWEHE